MPVTALRLFFIPEPVPALVKREMCIDGGPVKGKAGLDASRYQGESRGVGGARRVERGLTIKNKSIGNTVTMFYFFQDLATT